MKKRLAACAILFACGGSPAVPDASHSTAVIQPEGGVVADGVASAQVQVLLRDARGAPLPGLHLDLSADGQGNQLPSAGTTDANGSFTASIRSTRAETKTVAIKAGPLSFRRTVTFVPGPADSSHSSLTPDSARVPSDGTSVGRLTVLVADAQGNDIVAAPVLLTASGGAVLAPAAGSTDTNGTFHALVSSTAIGQEDLTAQVASLSLHAAVEFTSLPVDSTKSSLTAEAKTPVADAVSSVTLTLRLHDRLDRGLPGIAATFAVNASQVDCGACVTDAGGVVIGAVTSQAAGTHHVVVTTAVAVLETDVSFVAGPPSADGSRLTVFPAQAPANGSAQLTLTARVADKFGNVLTGVVVGLAAGGTDNTLSAGSCTSGASGTCAASLASTRGETKLITATVAGFDLHANAVFVPSPGPQSTFGTAPASALADGLVAVSLRVSLVDHSGQAMPGTSVLLSSNGRDDRFTPASGVTDSSGVFTAGLRSTRPGSKTLSASAVDATLTTSVTFLPPPWVNTTHDIFGGWISAFAFAPGVVYASVVEGLCTSRDGGHGWSCNPYVNSPGRLAVDPRDPGTVLACDGYQLMRTSDAGATWNVLPRAWSSFDSVNDIAIDPRTPTTLYVAVNAFGSAGGGVYKSIDDGASFSLLPGSPPTPAGVALQPGAPSNLLAWDSSNGIWWSGDGGASWAQGTGLPTASIVWLAFDPTDPQRVYATDSFEGLARSLDGGRTWTQVLVDQIFYAVRVDPQTGFVYANGFGGLLVSKDHAQTWQNTALTGATPPLMSQFEVDPAHAGALLFGGNIHEQWGVWRTDDGAATVSYSSDGIEMLFAPAVLADPQSADGAIMLAQGAQATHDRGATWSSPGTGLPADQYLSLARDPVTPARLFVSVSNNGVYRSTDSGATFASAGLQGQFKQVLAGGGRVIAVEDAFGAAPNHLHASDAAALAWSDLAVQAYRIASAAADPLTLYASFGSKFFRSQDGGQGWLVRSSTFPGVGQAVDVEVDPAVTDTVYVVTSSSQVWRSTDAGASWRSITPGSGAVAMAIDPTNSSVLYAVPGRSGVARSVDAGATWSDAAAGGLWGFSTAISISPVDPKVIWIGTESGGVFRTASAGAP